MRDPLEGVGADGMIVTGAARHRVPAAFEPILAAALAAVRDPAVSVHVYGSVATGAARSGTSDVDLLTVGLPSAAASRLQQQLTRRSVHPARAVEVAVLRPEDLTGEDDAAYGDRAFLKHCCVLLGGPDRRAALPPAAADARAARGFNGDIGRCLSRWRAALDDDASTPATGASQLGRRMARKTLLAVAGLVSVHDTTWTTDRASAAARWSQLRPRCAPDLARLVAWSGSTSPAPVEECARALEAGGIIERIVEDFRADIGLWR